MLKYSLFTEIIVYHTFYVVRFTRVTFLLAKFCLLAHATESVCVVFYLKRHFLPARVKKKGLYCLYRLASFLRITANYYRAQDRCDFFSFISKVLN